MLKLLFALSSLASGFLGVVLGCGGLPAQVNLASESATVKFVKPKGSRERAYAHKFQVSKKLTLTWSSKEVVVLQAYQKNRLVEEWKQARSGSEFEIPGAGETELKVWRPGHSTPDDAIWIWVKDE